MRTTSGCTSTRHGYNFLLDKFKFFTSISIYFIYFSHKSLQLNPTTIDKFHIIQNVKKVSKNNNETMYYRFKGEGVVEDQLNLAIKPL